MTVTKTYAVLDVSVGAYEEIKKRLEVVGAKERIQSYEGREVIVLGDIYLRVETDERVKVWLIFEGKKL